MIVGTLEANPSMGKISNESLVGQALMGKKVGEIVVISNAMRTSYKIKEIRYEL
jgi:transcription elongation factor GreA